MRTLKNWGKLKQRYYGKFPPRVQRDLRQLPPNGKVQWTGQSVFIFGEVETGKTVLAAQLMMEELKRIYLQAIPGAHNRTLFVSFPDMLAEVKRTFGNGESTDEVMHKYMDAHLLVLDDFFTTKPTDWVLETVYHLINYRYEQERVTIITSNFGLRELENILQDQRITSRINRSYVQINKQPFAKTIN